jgi:hypothetical protein
VVLPNEPLGPTVTFAALAFGAAFAAANAFDVNGLPLPNSALPTADFASPGASLAAALRPADPPLAASAIAATVPPMTLALVAADEPFDAGLAIGFAAGFAPGFPPDDG